MKGQLAEMLGDVVIPKKSTTPLWKGPEVDGITFSLLSRFLVCRERFRLLVVEGLHTRDTFNHLLEFGSMWHVCEEALARGSPGLNTHILYALDKYCEELGHKYPMDREKIGHWHSLCAALFPVYVEYWSGHKEVLTRTPIRQEYPFEVKYQLPSGRVVILRGKQDAVDLIGVSTDIGVWLQEDKTKSSIDPVKMARQLTFDLQTMMYMVALHYDPKAKNGMLKVGKRPVPIRGVRYNVVKRSMHKSAESMLKKVHEDIADGRGGEWFSRWTTEITVNDVNKFRQQCLDPILENLCNWWDHQTGQSVTESEYAAGIHWRHPFGVYNVLDEGGASDLDAYLATGSESGLTRTKDLFPELKT